MQNNKKTKQHRASAQLKSAIDKQIIATNSAIEEAMAKSTAEDYQNLDFIKIIEDVVKKNDASASDSQLADMTRRIIANDFEKTAEDKFTLNAETAKKLGLFSLGFVNAVANSFMGLPSAAILVGLDHLFTTPLAVAALTGPDKILLIIIAIIILTVFMRIAYKQNFVKAKAASEQLQQVYKVCAQYVLNAPPERELLNQALRDKYTIKTIRAIRSGTEVGEFDEVNHPLLLAEQKFQAAAAAYNFKNIADDNEDKINAVMRNVNYLTAFSIIALSSYFVTIALVAAIFPVFPIIPIIFTILLAQQVIKLYVTEYYKPKTTPTTKNEYYLALYRVMKKYREDENASIDIYIQEVTDNNDIRTAIKVYLSAYKSIPKNAMPNIEQLQEIDNSYIMLHHNQYQKYFSRIGNVLGLINSVINGVLCCAFGITGTTAVIAIFIPGFQLGMTITIIAAIALFLGGTIHSSRFTRRYITKVFGNFGQTLDGINVTNKKLSWSQWLNIINQKLIANRNAIAISIFTSIALSIVGFLAIASLISNLPISLGAIVIIMIVTTLLNLIACCSIFTETLQSSAKKTTEIKEIQQSLPQEEKDKRQKLNARLNKHYMLSAITTFIAFSICVSPVLALTVVPALFIAFATFFTVFMTTAIADFNNIKKHNQTRADIINLRVRICIIGLFGLAFGITSGPAVAALVFSILPAAVIPMSVIVATSIIAGSAIGISLCYTYILVYWNESIKPNNDVIDWNRINLSSSEPKMANMSYQKTSQNHTKESQDAPNRKSS